MFGIDFGTSNSAVAELSDNGEVRLAKWKVPDQLARTAGLKTDSLMDGAIISCGWRFPQLAGV